MERWIEMVKQVATKKDYTKFTLESACAHIKMMDGKQTLGWRLEYVPAGNSAPEHWKLTRQIFINQLSGFVWEIQ